MAGSCCHIWCMEFFLKIVMVVVVVVVVVVAVGGWGVGDVWCSFDTFKIEFSPKDEKKN